MPITRDLVAGISTMVIGAAYLYFATQIRTSALDDTMGSGGIPRAYGWIMLFLGAVIAFQGLVKAMQQRGAISTMEVWSGQGRKLIGAAGLLAVGIVYLLIVNYVGYGIAIGLLIAATAFYGGAENKRRVLLIAASGALALWLIFVLLLGVSMPKGILWQNFI